MYSPESYIHVIQSTKKQWTNRLITDKKLNEAAIRFIDAQTVFAEMLAKNTMDMSQYYIDAQTRLWFGNQK